VSYFYAKVSKYTKGATMSGININSVNLNDKSLSISYSNGKIIDYNYFWLRDNCPSAFHPQTKERNFDLLSINDNIRALEFEITQDSLKIKWSEQDHLSEYDVNWLKNNAYNEHYSNFLMMPEEKLWDSTYQPAIFNYEKVKDLDSELYQWLQYMCHYGLSIIDNMPSNDVAMEEIAHRIGHLRETNFGIVFNVQSKPNPNNQAYTSERLPLHTDLPNQETPPGYQFLHCLHNEADGGESTFVDGFAAARQLEKDNKRYFDLLVNYKIPFRFHDEKCDIREMRPVISVVDGEVNEIIFNAHIASTFNLPADIMHEYYLAYRAFIRILNSPQYLIKFKLEGGQMVVFDNRRVLHGRESFNPQTGKRHLRGCYVDRTEFKSKYRKLKQSLAV
jgi:gamma-butyrobetaine dioxygenase